MRRILLGLAIASTGCGSATDGYRSDEVPAQGDSLQGTDGGTGGDSGQPDAVANGLKSPAISFTDTALHQTTTRMLTGDPFDVVVSGLSPGATVTLDVCYDGFGNWETSATFKASSTGTVDLSTMAPTTGGWSVADPDGLFWSMTKRTSACPGQSRDTMLVTATVGGSKVASATLTWLLMADGVKCTKVSDGGLVGLYCAPAGGAKAGGIVTFGGSEGGLSTGAAGAQYYASLGYPTLGLAYFGAGSLPKTLENIPLEYFQTAFGWLAKQKEVVPGKLLVTGMSRGGELSLILGATFPEVTAVIAELPSGLGWGSLNDKGDAWTYKGKPLAHIPNGVGSGKPFKVHEPGGVTAEADVDEFTSAIKASTPAEVTAATTEVQKTGGPILMIGGADDQLWGACDLAKYAVDVLASSGHAKKYGDTLLCYPNAGHNVDLFGIDSPTGESMYYFEGKSATATGGTAQGIAQGSRQADTHKRAFLAANLK